MRVQAKLILWQQGQSSLWSGVVDGRAVLGLDQPCEVTLGAALRDRCRRISGVLDPSLLAVHGVQWGERAGVGHLLLERVPGVPVATVEQSFSEDAVCEALEQLGGAVAACHQRGLSLGSLHPGQILLTRAPVRRWCIAGLAPQGSVAGDLRGLAQVCRGLLAEPSPPMERLLSFLELGRISAAQASRSAGAMRVMWEEGLRQAS